MKLFIAFLVLANLFFNPANCAKKPLDRVKAEALLKKKCMDCHSMQTVYPWYYNFPIIKDLIDADVAKGRAMLDLEDSVFSINDDKEIPKPTLLKIKSAIVDNWMPPIPYRIMHWDKIINNDDKEVISAWVDRLEGKGIVPLPSIDELKVERSLSEEKIALGEKLYHDTRLSGDNSLSCASCHDLAKGGTDQKQFSTGINGAKGGINSPTVYNSVYNLKQFWDGRADTLEAQAHGPVHNPGEMGSNWQEVITKLSQDAELMSMFKSAYAINSPEEITGDMIANAIAEYEQTLITPDSPFDNYLRGQETALSAEERKGYELFKKHQCATCHSGIAIGGQSFELMGKQKDYFGDRAGGLNGLKTMPHKNEDNGRFNVTRKNSDKHKFKVPSLRNVELTYPYMHDGNVKSLQEAVRIMAEYQVGKKLSDEETTLIVKFLKTLTGTQHSAPQPSALPEPANGAEAAVTSPKSPVGATKARKL